MEPISTTISSAILKTSIAHFTKKVLDATFSLDKNIFGTLVINIDDLNIFIKKTYENILKIRTIHSAERDVFLDDIYSPINIRTENNESIEINDNFHIVHSKIINIIGSAGQGKSTIMRKIYANEICIKNRFPIFLELRRVGKKSILQTIHDEFLNAGINTKLNSIEKLLSDKNVTLLLDGFDEVIPELRENILNEITSIKSKYGCNIITSSRPDTEICNKTLVVNCRVERLTINQIRGILNKIDINENADEIYSSISKNKNLLNTLISPILVNLLYICYPFLD